PTIGGHGTRGRHRGRGRTQPITKSSATIDQAGTSLGATNRPRIRHYPRRPGGVQAHRPAGWTPAQRSRNNRALWGRSVTRIIAVAMQKGGTGKTTCSVNVAAGLARGVAPDVLGPQRVLLVDVDPQANATAVFLSPQFTLGPAEGVATTYEVLVNQTPARESIKAIALPANERAGYPAATLDILPSHIRLARAELDLLGVIRREDRLASALKRVAKDYDFIIIDCPPSLGILTLNALIAAGEILIPVEPGYFPLIGIGLL